VIVDLVACFHGSTVVEIGGPGLGGHPARQIAGATDEFRSARSS